MSWADCVKMVKNRRKHFQPFVDDTVSVYLNSGSLDRNLITVSICGQWSLYQLSKIEVGYYEKQRYVYIGCELIHFSCNDMCSFQGQK